MYLNLACGPLGITGLDWRGQIQLAGECGFQGLDAPVVELAALPEPGMANEALRQACLRWGGFPLPLQFRQDQQRFDQDMVQLPVLASVAQRLGVTRCYTWIMPGHDELTYEQNWNLHVTRLTPAARVLGDLGIRMGLEFVGPRTLRETKKYPFIHRLDQMLELCAAVGDNVGVLLDSFHWYTSHSSVDQLVSTLTNDRVVYVHVNDAVAGKGPDEQIDNQRALPCATGVIDAAGFIAALDRIGYDGPITCEPFMPELGTLAPHEAADRVLTAMKAMLNAT